MSTTLTLMMTTTMTMMMREEPHFARCTPAPLPSCPLLVSPHTQHLSGCHSLTLTATCSVCSYVVSCLTVVLTHTQQVFAPPSTLLAFPHSTCPLPTACCCPTVSSKKLSCKTFTQLLWQSYSVPLSLSLPCTSCPS